MGALDGVHVGIDPSLTSTGIAVLAPGEQPRLTLVTSKPNGSTLRDRSARIALIVQNVSRFILQDAPAFDGARILIEAPLYGAAMHQGSQHDRAGMWWTLVKHLISFGADVTEVSPTTVKAFATGKGNAGKPEMMAATAQQHPGVPFQSDDDSDALWIATLGEYRTNPDAGRVSRTQYRDKAAATIPVWAK